LTAKGTDMGHEQLTTPWQPTVVSGVPPLSRLAPAFEEALGRVDDAVTAIENGRGGEAELGAITTNLARAWRLVDRDPGLEVAAADLLDGAAALARAPIPATAFRLRRLVREAQARFRERLACARPRRDGLAPDPRPAPAKAISVHGVLAPLWRCGTSDGSRIEYAQAS
jgi:hypothetical protein